MREPFEIYIHIPFCIRKCAYCDFLSFSADKSGQRSYVDALLAEIAGAAPTHNHCPQAGTLRRPALAERGLVPREAYVPLPVEGSASVPAPGGGCASARPRETSVFIGEGSASVPAPGGDYASSRPRVTSVFIGGGTPSVLPAEWIAEIMETLREYYDIENDAEMTIEANPGTVDAEKLRVYREAGINRISFGCQSTQQEELALLGRIHSYPEFEAGFHLAREAGFANINADLIFGIPGQTPASWESSLRRVAELSPEHISAYSLILEEGTPLADAVTDEEADREMFGMTAGILEDYGLVQYEISNYAKDGFACRHNIGYWTGVPYLGFGLGASSFLPGEEPDTALRFRNTDSMAAYLRDSAAPERIRCDRQELGKTDLEAEHMILGLRMTDGVSAAEFTKRFGEGPEEVYGEVINRHVDAGLLVRAGERIRLTRRGLSLANVVMRDFLS